MRVYVSRRDWYGRRYLPRRWTPATVLATLLLGAVALALAVALLVLAIVGAILIGGAYLGYRVLRAALKRDVPEVRVRPAGRTARRMAREARGLLEMARTPDPLDRFLLAVREFNRLSDALLALDPAETSRRRFRTRAQELAEQAVNLHDAVTEIEREARMDRRADGVLASVWELAVASRELAAYGSELARLRHALTLGEMRALVARRGALQSRHNALVDRLRDAQLHRPHPTPHHIPVRGE